MKRLLAIGLAAAAYLALNAGPASAAHYHLVAQWGSEGSDDGQFDFPIPVAVDQSTGDVYVGDSGNQRVQKFTASGTFLRQIGEGGSGAGEFGNTRGLAVGPQGGVYVADGLENRVQKFSSMGVFEFATHGFPGGFNGPEGVAVSAQGDFYVTDFRNKRIAEYTSGGGFIRQWTIHTPSGIAIDRQAGRIYVGGAVSGNGVPVVRVFDTSGNPFVSWPVVNGAGMPPSGGEVDFPAVGAGGDVFVSTGYSVWKFTRDGQFITKFGGAPGGGTGFVPVWGVAVSKDGRVYEVVGQGPDSPTVREYRLFAH
jgi:NHL repeat-containing protein